MRVFLSWSGQRSHEAAKAFYDWLPDVLQSVRPWMSSEDICSGAGWNQEIREALNESNFGIIFVTRENRESPWLMFEAGAIAKHVQDARVVPLLVDDGLKPEMLIGPLGQLQARSATREMIFRLLRDVNFACVPRLSDDRLGRCFDANWSSLGTRLASLPEASGEVHELSEKDVLLQILNYVRNENKPTVPQVRHNTEVGTRIGRRNALRRLELRIDELGLSLTLRSKIIDFWETLNDDEESLVVNDEGYNYTIFRNGEIRVEQELDF